MKYLDCEFKIFDNVYKPSDDSLLLAENLEVMPEDRILEIGIGCGILSILAAKCGAKVVGIDISIIAAKCSKYNSQINKVRQNLNIIVGDLMNPLKKSQKFDLIIFNPPYLPELRLTDSIIERAWNGGKKGNEIILRFIKEIKDYLSENGRILMVFSSLSRPEEIFNTIEKLELSYRIITEKSFFFEKIFLIEIKKSL